VSPTIFVVVSCKNHEKKHAMINKFVPHQGAQKFDACQGHLPERLKFIGDHDIQMFILEALILYSIDRQYIESAKH
jgi:hypothetical protein